MLVIFIIGYNIGNQKVGNDNSENISFDTVIQEEFNKESSSQISTIDADSILRQKQAGSVFIK